MAEYNEIEAIERDSFMSKSPIEKWEILQCAFNEVENEKQRSKDKLAERTILNKVADKYIDRYFEGQNQNKRLTLTVCEILTHAFRMPKPKKKCARKKHLKWLKKMKNTYYRYKLIPGIYEIKELL